MKVRTIILWIFILVIIDQIIKIVINSFFLESQFEIIPSLFEFKPFFNGKHSYVNSLIYKHFNINIGLFLHIILFLFSGAIIFSLYGYFRNNVSENKKLLDTAIIFQTAALICALIGNLIWKKGVLDYMYLKPLFIFDLKDLYVDSFVVLFFIYTYKNKEQIKKIKMKDIVLYTRHYLKKITE